MGVLGNPLLGTIQDTFLDQRLAAQNPALHEKIAAPAQSKFGLTFQPLDKTKIETLPDAEKAEVETIRIVNNQATLAKVAVLPAVMFLCYCGLILYFRSRGGYRRCIWQNNANRVFASIARSAPPVRTSNFQKRTPRQTAFGRHAPILRS